MNFHGGVEYMRVRAVTTFLLALSCLRSGSGQSTPRSAGHEFDFWIGAWKVNLRIKQPDGSWKDQVQAREFSYPILGGKAILELWNETSRERGTKGYSLRYYRDDIGKWELWLNWPSRNSAGSSSLTGVFRHNRGEFFSTYQVGNGDVTARYTFSDISRNAFRWDDAFSSDTGKTWSNRWIMEFTRESALPPALSFTRPANSYGDGQLCDSVQFRRFDPLSGELRGTMKYRNGPADPWQNATATLKSYKIIGGCATIGFLEYMRRGVRYQRFLQNTYNSGLGKFEVGELDNLPGTNYRSLFGQETGGRIELEGTDPTTSAATDFRSTWTIDGGKFKMEEYRKFGGQWVLIGDGNFTTAR